MEHPGNLYQYFLQGDDKGIHKWHHYFDVYDRFFAPYKDKPVVLLEIGVFRGSSLRMWQNYFSDSAKIVGIDIDPHCKQFEEGNIQVFIGDQTDEKFLSSVISQIGPPDIIIDDGGHTANQQITSFSLLYPQMSPEGLYIVEDTCTSFIQKFQDRKDGLTFLDYAKSLSDKLTWWFQSIPDVYYKTPPSQRTSKVLVPEITKSTYGIHFFNSMVVFERKPITEPYSETR